MNVEKLETLKHLIVDRLSEMESGTKNRKNEVLLTKGILEFIMFLTEEELSKQSQTLVASDEDMDAILGGTI